MKTKVIKSKHFPFKGFVALCLWPFVFVRKDSDGKYGATADNHERIHAEQQKEMLVLPFLLWYGLEWLIKLFAYRNAKDAYMNISLEREAYENMANLSYIENRRRYGWIKLIIRRV